MIKHNIFLIGTSREYYKAPGAQNCPKNLIITSTQECKTASSLLGLEFVNHEIVRPEHRPAGCFWGRGQFKPGQSGMNSIIDSDLTSFSTDWTWTGGICKSEGKI